MCGRNAATIGGLFAAFTGVVWGGQFVVAKSALDRVDAFWLTSVRYALAVLVLLALLAIVEGARRSPRAAARLGS